MGTTPSHGARRRRPLGTAAIIALALLVAALPALDGRAQRSPETLDAGRERIRALEQELVGIDARASRAATAASAARSRAAGLGERIATTSRELAETRAARAVALERLADRLVAIYLREPPSFVELLLTSGGLTEAVDAQRALEAVGDGDRRMVALLDASRRRLEDLRGELLADRERARRAAREAGARSDELEALIGRRRAVLSQARSRLQGLLAAEERRRAAAALAAAQARAERDLRRQAEPDPEPVTPPPPPPPRSVAEHLERIAQCESGGNPRAVSASGRYRGKYQFDLQTWAAVGGTGDPAEASEEEQDRRAAILYGRRGPAPWPVCGYR